MNIFPGNWFTFFISDEGFISGVKHLSGIRHAALKQDADEAIAAIQDRISAGDSGRLCNLKAGSEKLIIPLNKDNPTPGTLNPPHLASDRSARPEISFMINEDTPKRKWFSLPFVRTIGIYDITNHNKVLFSRCFCKTMGKTTLFGV